MPAISRPEAVERLASAVEKASSDDVAQIFLEIHPAAPVPDVSGPKAEVLAHKLAGHIREGIEPEEIVDLWNVVFPSARGVRWDEEDEVLRYHDRRLNHAEQ